MTDWPVVTIGKVAPGRVVGHRWRYLLALVAGLVVLAAVPWFFTALLK